MINIDKYRIKAEKMVSDLTLSQKVNLMCQYQDAVPNLGIKKYKHGTEASHGISWLGKATMFPQPIGLAHLWDKKLMKKIGNVIGKEARGFFAKNPEINGLTLWAPTIDLNRDPRWGRTDEGYGEDPTLVGNLATELIKGIQGDDPDHYMAMPTLKHFYGNNNEVDRGMSSTNISERIKREYYLKVFQIAIEKSGVMSMMTAYNSINGIPANIHPDLQNIVRDEWGWPGFVVSDAGDVLSLIHEHKFVTTPEEAVILSIKAGIDSITDDHDISKKAIFSALLNGKLEEKDLDRALSRVFLARHILGEFDKECKYNNINESVIGCEEHGKVALDAAIKSIVLLKNSMNVLPIKDKESSICILGNMADRIYRDWYSGEFLYEIPADRGLKEYYKDVKSYDCNDRVTIKDNRTGLYLNPNGEFSKNKTIYEMEDWGWGAVTFRCTENGKYLTCNDDNTVSATADTIWGWFTKEVFYTKTGRDVGIKTWNSTDIFQQSRTKDGEIGITASTPLQPVDGGSGYYDIEVISNGIEEGLKYLEGNSKPIVIIGNHPLINGKETIDRHDITLPTRQKKLALKIVEKRSDAVLILVGSYPFAIEELKDKFSTIIYTSHLGQETGNALKAIVSGEKNPGGRLPITWYKSAKDLGNIMDYELPSCEKTYLYFNKEVDFPFGYGLSYTNFTYNNINIDRDELKENQVVNITVTITNSGNYSGDEVVELYIKHFGKTVKRPVIQLVDFDRIFLEKGESRTITFNLPAKEFYYWSENDRTFKWEQGKGEIIFGRSSRDPIIKKEIILV